MDPDLVRLIEIMPPGPVLEHELDWPQAEADLGVVFPASFKAFVDEYGLGSIAPELAVLDPRDTTFFRAMLVAFTEPIDVIPWQDLAGPRPPYPAFPGPGPRLLSVGTNGNGDALYLVVRDGEADDSEMWLGNIRGGDWQRVEGPYCRFILDLVVGQHRDRLGAFDYWAWHLEPTWMAAPERPS